MPAFELRNVVVVDDDRFIRTVLADALQENGFSVTTYATAEEAIEALAREPADVLVTDLHLPRMSGFELLEAVRGRPALRELPCVAISSRDWPEEVVADARVEHALMAVIRK